MSLLTLSLSSNPAPAQWGTSAILSFSESGATVHIGRGSVDALRIIKKAARHLDGLGNKEIQLIGDWNAEQQWAFVCSYVSPKKPGGVHFVDNADKAELQQRAKAMLFTRDLINRAPEDIHPQSLAKEVSQWLSSLSNDITVKTIEGDALLEQGWIGIHGVGRGSQRPPLLLEVDFNPTGNPDAKVSAALVGKGITFDSGGYSIKSSEGMLTMKCDMGGAATVAGALGLAIMQGLEKRVKMFLCCAENLISGNAYKLGDILTYKNGTTVEVVNTDAEGRLVLADGLMAAGETGAPLIIDAATLTGAAMVAVGSEYNALFGLDKPLVAKAVQVAESVNEPAWPLPLEKWHQDNCPSAYADTANSRPVKGGGAGGASNAAGFLSRFVPNEGQGWLHFDLASAFNNSATNMLPAGATAAGIRTIAQLIRG
ncbi:aminopeptidase PepB [Neptunicella marina]|uniref:Aminopeptidase PepB n=1 Tax=Neptunicella marina TaxID=2125989 RepID=A0A8J6M4D1_9ALTE|nr:aminopeptidase PepB [Neptunicella marina]MBC3766011.1 aminopeptidase PepB [Neptunicella marina]